MCQGYTYEKESSPLDPCDLHVSFCLFLLFLMLLLLVPSVVLGLCLRIVGEAAEERVFERLAAYGEGPHVYFICGGIVVGCLIGIVASLLLRRRGASRAIDMNEHALCRRKASVQELHDGGGNRMKRSPTKHTKDCARVCSYVLIAMASIFALLVVIIFVLIPVYFNVSDKIAEAVEERNARLTMKRYSIRFLYHSLAAYADRHGVLPHSPKGPEYALYEVKPYIAGPDLLSYIHPPGDVALFDVPYSRLGNGAAAWDDSNRRVVNIDFDYINEPRALDRSSPSYPVYAEKIGSTKGGRWVVFCNGAMLWVSRGNPDYRSVFGKSMGELAGAQPASVRTPEGYPGTFVDTHRTRNMHFMRSAFVSYQKEHGVIPHSERGQDYALYRLKAYLPDAEVFDALYTNLENGVAYWDDEAKRLANGDFLYINKAIVLPEDRYTSPRDDFVIIADKRGVHPRGLRLLVLSSGYVAYLPGSYPPGDNPLGMTHDEVFAWQKR